LNSEKIWKIGKKSKLNSEKIWKMWKKSKLNSEKKFIQAPGADPGFQVRGRT
jgi:hypothetical protein